MVTGDDHGAFCRNVFLAVDFATEPYFEYPGESQVTKIV
jgi:hypothetical protein